jgi:hypothetical protein
VQKILPRTHCTPMQSHSNMKSAFCFRLVVPAVRSSAWRLHCVRRRLGGKDAISRAAFDGVRGNVIAAQEFSAASFFGWAPPLRALVRLLSPAAHRLCCCCLPLAATSLLPGQTPAAAEPLLSAVQVGVGIRLPVFNVSQAQRY